MKTKSTLKVKAASIALTISFFLLLPSPLKADVLRRTISVELVNVELSEALKQVSYAGGFDYSYNAQLLIEGQKVSIKAINKTVNEVLKEILKNTNLTFKENRGTILFYQKKKKEKVLKVSNLLNGRVTDTLGLPIEGVLIYEEELGLQTLTNDSGFYLLNVNSPKINLSLVFSRANYDSKEVPLKLKQDQILNVSLVSKPFEKSSTISISAKETLDSSLAKTKPPTLFIPEKVAAEESIEDTLKTKFAAGGLFPPADSKGLDAGKEINHFSFYVLTDYGAGAEGFSFSGLATVYRFHLSGIGIAGLGHWLGGNMNGIQFAGLLNNNGLYTNGIQISGLVNMTGIHMAGLQVSGITNINRNKLHGLQITGIGNYTQKSTNGIQLAGLFNWSGVNRGIQLAAIYNASRKSQGLQIGLINSSKRIDGLQIGLINIADSAKFGGQFGLLNIVKHNGYRQMEISYDDLAFVNFSYRSGAKHLYSYLQAGAAVKPEEPLYRLGYGIGTDLKIVGPLAFNLEVEAFHITENPWVNDVSILGRAKAGLAVNLAGLAFFGTLNYNGYITDYLNEDNGRPKISLIADPLAAGTQGHYFYQLSSGFSAGIRINL
jgi:hypothetical protein